MRRRTFVCVLLTAQLLTADGQAAMAVIDASAISRLVQQLRTAEQQLSTTRDALREAQQTYQAMTGTRGTERLLSGANRNYLPTTWGELSATLSNTQSAYGALTRELQGLVQANAVLSPTQLASFAPNDRAAFEAQRQEVALLQALTRTALSATSQRFASLQQLIDAIANARDPKAIAELEARIAAEQAMLANDASKLATLYQSAQAQQAATQWRLRERAISDVGSLRALPPMGLE